MGITHRKLKLAEFRRNDIVEAAERIFFSKGYLESTIDDVAKEAQYSKRTIYTYFDSKDEIYLEVMLKGFKILNELLENGIRDLDTGIDRIKAIGDIYFKFSQIYPGYMQAIINYKTRDKVLDFCKASKDSLENNCYREGEKPFTLLTDAIRRGIGEGNITPEIDVTNTAITLWSSMAGFIILVAKKQNYIRHQYDREAEELFEATIGLMLRSLKK